MGVPSVDGCVDGIVAEAQAHGAGAARLGRRRDDRPGAVVDHRVAAAHDALGVVRLQRERQPVQGGPPRGGAGAGGAAPGGPAPRRGPA
jgi:hypothetical protein